MIINPDLLAKYSNETLALISANATHFTLISKNDADKELQRRALESPAKKILIDDISAISHQVHKGIRDNKTIPELNQYVEGKNIDREISNNLVQKIYKFHNLKQAGETKSRPSLSTLFSGLSGFFK